MLAICSRFLRLTLLSIFILNPFLRWGILNVEAIRTDQTIWYMRSTTASSAFETTGPTAEFSSVSDLVSGSPAAKTTALAMTSTPGSSQTTIAATETSTSAGNIWLATYLSPKLAAQTMTSGTIFRYETSFAESNLNANMILRLHIYIWREGSGYVSSIIDNVSGTNCGAEPGAANSARSQICLTAATASNISISSGDQIALEVWTNANNISSTSFTGTLYQEGTEFIGNGTTSHVTTSAKSMLAINKDLDLYNPTSTSTVWYLNNTNASSAFGTTGPTTEYSSLGTDGWSSGPASKTTAKSMNDQPNTGASSLTFTENSTSAMKVWMGTFLSPPLATQTLPAGTAIRYEGALEENGSLADMFTQIHIYVWRQGTGYVSSIVDNVGVADCGAEAGSVNPRASLCITTATTDSTAIQDGDQIALEVWVSDLNVSATPYSATFWYGGLVFIEQGTGVISPGSSVQTMITFSNPLTLLSSLGVDIVDSSSVPVSSPSVTLSSASYSNANQTTTGTLGTSNAKIRVVNWGASNTWTLSLAPTAGSTTTWSNGGSLKYDFNDAATGLDGADADEVGGRLSVDPSVGTLTSPFGCLSTTGVSKGSSSSFAEGSVNSISLLVAGGTTGYNCAWDLTGATISQIIPAYQAGGSYSLPLTLSIL